ncbi:hypothetical protein VT84_19060 [Gemmata sp. SH-PL17]|uniref:hypothetical protein n=1 Tax=Gemmata sp. SH-PL17 TaxID=1630693 RepID=UPI00078DBA22|nr:hypothetical protein [Gemmata sp. SH-PL17]AMV26507.1 hypothetical protein VT84_19060 [Gemmata sp. SH-PL17]
MLGLVGHIRRSGYDDRLAPLFSHGTVHVFDKAGDGERHIVVYPPVAGSVRIELLEGDGAEARAVESRDVPEQDGIATFDSILPRISESSG